MTSTARNTNERQTRHPEKNYSGTRLLTPHWVYTRTLRSIYPKGRILVPKRLIDLDDELLAAAQRELRTTGVSDTVRIALQQAAAKSARARQIEWLEQGGLESMAGQDERGEVWR
jgi:Arc/MetJ family transcription regulator